MLFQPFNKATRRETPAFLDAEISQAKFENASKQQANALRSGNMLGGAELYNEAMGESTPIADYMFGAPESIAGEEAIMAGGEGAVDAAVANSMAGTEALAGAETAALGTEAAVGAEALAGAEVAGGAAAAGGEGALASMGPYGWAILAAMALANS